VASLSYHRDTDTCDWLLHHQDSDDFPPVGNTSKTGRTHRGASEQQQRKMYLRSIGLGLLHKQLCSRLALSNLRIRDLDTAFREK